MHQPYHLFEFTRESFRRHGRRVGYELADAQITPGDPLVPGLAGGLFRRLMSASGTGMQLAVWLRAT